VIRHFGGKRKKIALQREKKKPLASSVGVSITKKGGKEGRVRWQRSRRGNGPGWFLYSSGRQWGGKKRGVLVGRNAKGEGEGRLDCPSAPRIVTMKGEKGGGKGQKNREGRCAIAARGGKRKTIFATEGGGENAFSISFEFVPERGGRGGRR